MDPEAFYDLTRLTGVATAPDGDRVAFTADEFDRGADDRVGSVFVAPTDGSRQPHRLTRASAASSPTWSPDGSKLAVLASRDRDLELAVTGGGSEGEENGSEGTDDADEESDRATGDDPKRQVWVWDLDRGGDARQATDLDEGVRSFDWSPDGDRLVVAARDPTDEEREYLDRREDGGPVETERLQHKFDGAGYLDTVTTYLFVVDPDEREATRLDDAYGGGAYEPSLGLQPAWGADEIAFLSNRTDDPDDSLAMDVYAVRPDGTGLRRVTDGDVGAANPTWSPSGERLAFTADDPASQYRPTELYVADDDGVRSVSADLDRPLVGRGGVDWLDEETLLGTVGDEGLTRLVRFHADGAAPERAFAPAGDRTLRATAVAGGTVALGVTGPGAPPDVYAADARDAAAATGATTAEAAEDVPLTRLTRLNADFVDEQPAPNFARVTWKNGDGGSVEGLLFLPPAVEAPGDGADLPLVVSIHGGPVAYDAPSFRFQRSLWTAQGYAVLCPNYRGSSSYGRAFSEAIAGDWGPREVDDVRSGVDHLVERGVADPDRLFVTGFSYGAMTTAYLVTATDRFAAAAAEHGVYDYRGSFGVDDCHGWWERDLGLPWEAPETYDRVSSYPDVGAVETPLLVTAGEEDWRCPPSQSEQLYVSVKKQGVPARLVVYPDEHHAVGDPDRAVHRFRELTEWFERHDPGA